MPAPAAAMRGTAAILRELVAFPTVSRDSNLDLIHYACDMLKARGASTRLTYDDDRRKANLFATFGPEDRQGIVLSGHTDVVPVEGQPWDTDPYAVIEKDGRLYGRGTADMKGFLACALALAPELASSNLRAPVHFALSYDEEVGCLGIGRLIADLVQAGIRPRACVVGEPTMMSAVIAHKGKHSYRCTVRGLATHSAYAPQGVNAVEAAAEAIAYLKSIARRHRDRGPFDRAFDVPYSTVHTGVIRGGTALNIVPSECVFDFEFRHLPSDDQASFLEEVRAHLKATLEPEMRAVSAATGFEIKQLSEMPALDMSPESEIVGLVQELTGNADLGKVSYGTEASQFQRAGMPAVVCGPGSIAQAHKPNEFVALEQLEQCERFLRALIERLCASP